MPELRLSDLIVADGPTGAELILVPGLSVEVFAGEIAAVLVDDHESADALMDVVARDRHD